MRLVRRAILQFGALTLWLLTAGDGKSQAISQSASDLVRFLTYQSDRPGKFELMAGLEGCGHFDEDRTAARALVSLGRSASPELERALTSLDENGEESAFSVNGAWLLEAYASIEGPHALPRLLQMVANPRLRFLEMGLDNSVAVSLSLTSYVSGTRGTERIFRCQGSVGPRDALDQLVLGWLKNDRAWFERSLGPDGTRALNHLLAGKDWTDLHGTLWPPRAEFPVALGYRFQRDNVWLKSGDISEDHGVPNGFLGDITAPELNVDFTDRVGKDCGKHSVRFVADGPAGGGATKYLVDDSDLAGLLRVITSCLTKSQ